jgi:hypothetical protein
MRQTFTFEPGPRKGGIDDTKVAPAFQLSGELKVMEDTKDSLDNLHERPEREAPASIVTND